MDGAKAIGGYDSYVPVLDLSLSNPHSSLTQQFDVILLAAPEDPGPQLESEAQQPSTRQPSLPSHARSLAWDSVMDIIDKQMSRIRFSYPQKSKFELEKSDQQI